MSENNEEEINYSSDEMAVFLEFVRWVDENSESYKLNNVSEDDIQAYFNFYRYIKGVFA